jgi:hypothetical protein
MGGWRSLIVLAAALVAAAAAAAWLVGRGQSGPASVSFPTVAAAPDYGRALLLARRHGDVLVGLAARPGGPVDVTVIPPSLDRLSADSVRLAVDGGAPARPIASCGSRCYRFRVAALTGRAVRLAVAAGRAAPARFTLPAALPPGAGSLFRRVTRKMKQLRFVRVDESLSNGKTGIEARFELQAPDRMRYATSAGNRAVVIGAARWDRAGGRWLRSDYQRIRQPAYMWEGARYARLLGRARLDGTPTTVVAAYRPDPTYPAWFRLFVAPDHRILRAAMVAPAHFMVDRFSAFDVPRRITPPRPD